MFNLNDGSNRPLVVLVVVLAVVVGLQSWFIVRQHCRLTACAASGATAPSVVAPKAPVLPWPAATSPAAAPGLLGDDDLFGSAFDADSWTPFQEMERLQDRMDRLFRLSLGRFGRSTRFADLAKEATFDPRLDVHETPDAYVVTIDLPGTDKATVEAKLDGQQLRVSGHRDQVSEEKDQKGNLLHRERRFGAFERTVRLPGPVDANRLSTKFEGGIMTVTVPKAAKKP